MPACPTSVGFDFGPLLPKKRMSPGVSEPAPRRSGFATSPLIAYVVRPFSTSGRSGAPGNGSSLKTRQMRPEQSNPPGATTVPVAEVALQSLCVFSELPEKTYG
jgi:hypothetical protein